MTLSKVAIADIMDVWAYPHELLTEELEYIHYLIQIRDVLIHQELDALCGFDMITAVALAEMQQWN